MVLDRSLIRESDESLISLFDNGHEEELQIYVDPLE
jgi:hypothetical protein